MSPKNTEPEPADVQTNSLPSGEEQIAAELQRLRDENARLEREKTAAQDALAAAQPKPRPPSGKIPKELVNRARDLVNGFKAKYAGEHDVKNTLSTAADYAFDVWEKAAAENVKTGAAQLDGKEPLIEKYFRRKLFTK